MNYSYLLEKINDSQEKTKILNEFNQIAYYRANLSHCAYQDVYSFITAIINEYRYKIEVKNYYTMPKDNISQNLAEVLDSLERMIIQYVIIKYAEEETKKKE